MTKDCIKEDMNSFVLFYEDTPHNDNWRLRERQPAANPGE